MVVPPLPKIQLFVGQEVALSQQMDLLAIHFAGEDSEFFDAGNPFVHPKIDDAGNPLVHPDHNSCTDHTDFLTHFPPHTQFSSHSSDLVSYPTNGNPELISHEDSICDTTIITTKEGIGLKVGTVQSIQVLDDLGLQQKFGGSRPGIFVASLDHPTPACSELSRPLTQFYSSNVNPEHSSCTDHTDSLTPSVPLACSSDSVSKYSWCSPLDSDSNVGTGLDMLLVLEDQWASRKFQDSGVSPGISVRSIDLPTPIACLTPSQHLNQSHTSYCDVAYDHYSYPDFLDMKNRRRFSTLYCKYKINLRLDVIPSGGRRECIQSRTDSVLSPTLRIGLHNIINSTCYEKAFTFMETYYGYILLLIFKTSLDDIYSEYMNRNSIFYSEACEFFRINIDFEYPTQWLLLTQEATDIFTLELNERVSILATPIYINEVWDRAEIEITEKLSYSPILPYRFDILTAQYAHILYYQASTENDSIYIEVSKYIQHLYESFASGLMTMNVKNNMMIMLSSYRTNRARIYTDKIRGRNDIDNDTSYTNKLVLPIPKSIDEPLSDPVIFTLDNNTVCALRQNKYTIFNITTRWNKICKVYEHPVKGLVLIRLEIPVQFNCCYNNKVTQSHLIGFTWGNPGKCIAAAAWSNSFSLFKDFKISTYSEFNLICFNRYIRPTCLDPASNIFSPIIETLNDLQCELEDINLLRLQSLHDINTTLRLNLGVSTPVPIDYANTPYHKTLSSIHDYSDRITMRPQLNISNHTLDSFPKSRTLDQLITKWNLANNTQHSTLNRLWTSQQCTLISIDIIDTIKNVPRIDKLPSCIPLTMHRICNIDAEVDTNCLNSHFANFTSNNPIDLTFNASSTISDNWSTLYHEFIHSPDKSTSTIQYPSMS